MLHSSGHVTSLLHACPSMSRGLLVPAAELYDPADPTDDTPLAHRAFNDSVLTSESRHLTTQCVMQYHVYQSGHQLARLRAEEHLRWIEGKPKDDYCRICDKRFPGLFIHHRRSQEHRRKERLTKRGCKLCETGGFNWYPDYVKHIDSDQHKMRKGELQHVQQVLAENFEEDQKSEHNPCEESTYTLSQNRCSKRTLDWSTSVPDHCPSARSFKKVRHNSSDKASVGCDWSTRLEKRAQTGCDDTASVSSEDDSGGTTPRNSDTGSLDGSEFIAPTQALFCQLCNQFFLTETGAKDKHCRSRMHQERYKAALHQQESSTPGPVPPGTLYDKYGPDNTRHMPCLNTGRYQAIKLQGDPHSRPDTSLPAHINSTLRMEIKFDRGEFIVRPILNEEDGVCDGQSVNDSSADSDNSDNSGQEACHAMNLTGQGIYS